MAIQKPSEEQLEIERQQELEDRDIFFQNEREKRDLELAKLKATSQSVERRKMVEAIAKIPALIILAAWVPILILAKREVPEPLLKSLSL